MDAHQSRGIARAAQLLVSGVIDGSGTVVGCTRRPRPPDVRTRHLHAGRVAVLQPPSAQFRPRFMGCCVKVLFKDHHLLTKKCTKRPSSFSNAMASSSVPVAEPTSRELFSTKVDREKECGD